MMVTPWIGANDGPVNELSPLAWIPSWKLELESGWIPSWKLELESGWTHKID
jgi:hypothetical protein